MGATKIMVIRHAEKPDKYNGIHYYGVDAVGTNCGAQGEESLVTIGWQRAGALATLFAPPWGPAAPLAQPQHLYAADPAVPADGDMPSQRPYQTLTAVAAKLGLAIDRSYRKRDFSEMVRDAINKDGVVLISWTHEDIPLLTADQPTQPGISQWILTATATEGTLGIPSGWPKGPNGARYDLVWVFDRPTGTGPITKFTLVPQLLLAGDAPAPVVTS